MLMAFMALARLKSVESLRYCAPGEWGKLLGLDQVPEVRTLRNKIRLLSNEDQPENNVVPSCASSGWRPHRNKLVGSTLMAMCGSVTATKLSCPGIMWRGSARVYAPPLTTGSMPWMDNLSLWLTKSLIPA